MPGTSISGLSNALTGAQVDVDSDLLAIVDANAGANGTKRITAKELIANTSAFTAAGTGAVARTMEEKARDIVSVEDFDVVGDDATAKTANKTALRKLISPTADGGTVTYTGDVYFPKGKTWDFDDIVTIRDGIHLNLGNGNVRFTKAAVAADAASGLLWGMRNFSIRNGTVTGVISGGAIGCIKVGQRGTEGVYFQNVYDSLLSEYQGNVEIRNVKTTSNSAAGFGVLMTGGLRNVTIDNYSHDGQSVGQHGVYYEYGWATNEADAKDRETSHARNLTLRNIEVKNLDPAAVTPSMGVGIVGAYNVAVENLRVRKAMVAFFGSPGESGFYRPWTGEDEVGAKHIVTLRNIVGEDIRQTGLSIVGSVAVTGYRSADALLNEEFDIIGLADYEVDGFAVTGTAGASLSYGVGVSANKCILRNGTIRTFYRGVFATACLRYYQDNVDVFDSENIGVYVTSGEIYTVGRKAECVIRNSHIAGSGTGGVSTMGVLLDRTYHALIESNTFGYNDVATATFSVTGGTSNPGTNQVTSITVNAVDVLGAAVDWVTSHTATAAAIAAQINTYSSAPDYTAVSSGATVLIQALTGTGATPNGYVVAVNVAGDVTAGSIKAMSGGKFETTQTESVRVGNAAYGVTIRGNDTKGVKAAGTAYVNNAVSPYANKPILEDNVGDVSCTANAWHGNILQSFTGTLTGCTTSPTGTIYYRVRGNTVEMFVPAFTATSNAVTKTITGMPAHIRPTAATYSYGTCLSKDNGAAYVASALSIATSGVISLFASADEAAFTAAGTFASRPMTITYQIQA